MKKLYLSLLLGVLGMLQAFGQVPVLNSFPSASAAIFLDFDGHHVAGTSWNWNGPFTCGPANLNEAQIREVFSRVAEDFRPFNVNVTTDSTRFHAAPLRRRMRVILTVTNEWYGSGAGGVASINSFSRGDNTPCFVFTKLHHYNVKNISEATSHEAGHTFGLRHQAVYDANCLKITDYNSGTGTGETGWAPIMGVGYNRNFTVWHHGRSSLSCTSEQSDIDIITNSTNAIGFRADDHGDALTAATALTVRDTAFIASGFITRSTDVDYFRVRLAKTSSLKLDAKPYSVGINNNGSNLDMRVSLLDANERLLASYNPAPKLSSFADTVLPAGEYFLKVEGTGNQNATDYGSLGSYSVFGDIEEIMVLPLQRLVLAGTNTNGRHQLRWELEADEPVVRQVLESSVDGSYFQAVKELSVSDRRWQQITGSATTVQYRLRVQLASGKEHYSNAIVLRNSADPTARPHLAGTVVNGSSVTLTSPVAYQYLLTDLTGKVLARGKADAGNTQLSTSTLVPGMYLVRFNWNGGEYVEKMVKR